VSDIQNISNRPSNKDKFIVRGDFNIPGTMWSLEEKLNIPSPYTTTCL